jgi:hypothetical protein
MAMPTNILTDNQTIPDDEGKRYKTTNIVAVAAALPHKSFPKLSNI